MRERPSEGWILAGSVAGRKAAPSLDDDVAGMPYLLRLACDLAFAGVRRIVVVWDGPGEPPSVERFARDERLRASVTVATRPPEGDDDDAILMVRADRVYHRDLPRQAAAAWQSSTAPVARVAGTEHDAVAVTTRARARAGIEAVLAEPSAATAPPPYLAFTTPAPDRVALRRAERQLIWSMRKEADGLASKAINRHLSLRLTRLLMRTGVRPNHVTVFCFALAVAGGIVMARGGYWAGVAGMLLVNLGSIVDGVDGELARLHYRFSRLGQWMDTLADDFGNVCYVTGLAINLDKAGVTWAVPLAVTALVCFTLTQTTQYALITKVYRSGDLAAIPWAFQSHDFLSSRPTGFIAWLKATAPKTLKRDFALTVFVGLALISRLDVILVIFSGGAIVFFVVFAVQGVRNLSEIRSTYRRGHHAP
jgi:1L-myo-inositol 1-phosphate cytidylyltransferase / CDP-L-myo-inositol myo-inositolphosphotransferase